VSDIEIKSEVTGKVWKIMSTVGERIDPMQPIMIIESMKMEIPVIAERAGVLQKLLVTEEMSVAEGQVVAILTV
jgi:acetyl-CoA carboxylase biotin carboxyl carrier protein